MKTILRICTTFLIGLSLAAHAEEYVIKFSHVVSPQTPKGLAAQYFADQVNQRLAGRVHVEVFPSSQLYNDNKVMEAMRLSKGNTGLMAAPSLSKFVKFSRQLQAFDLPYLFNGIQDVHTLADSPVAAKMTGPLERKGIKALGFWDNGMKVFSVRGDPALRRAPDDFKGRKFRIQSSNVHADMIKALGGSPQKLPFKEVYTALAQGVVDGQENAWSNIYSKKFHEVQDWISVSNHSYLGYLLVIGADFWKRLPEDIQTELTGIIREATARNREFAAAADRDDRRKVEQAGFAKVVDLTSEEREQWRRATAGVEARFRDAIGAQLLAEIHGVLGH